MAWRKKWSDPAGLFGTVWRSRCHSSVEPTTSVNKIVASDGQRDPPPRLEDTRVGEDQNDVPRRPKSLSGGYRTAPHIRLGGALDLQWKCGDNGARVCIQVSRAAIRSSLGLPSPKRENPPGIAPAEGSRVSTLLGTEWR